MRCSSTLIEVLPTDFLEKSVIFSYEVSAINLLRRILPVSPVAPKIIAVLPIASVIKNKIIVINATKKIITERIQKFIVLTN